MCQIVMPHENKDIKKINISQAAQSFSIFQTPLQRPFTSELISLTYQFVEYSINIFIIFMHFTKRKSIFVLLTSEFFAFIVSFLMKNPYFCIMAYYGRMLSYG